MSRPRAQTNPGVSPLVRDLVRHADDIGYTLAEVGRQAGIDSNVLYRWNLGANPSLYLFEAALNVLGYRLAIVPITEGCLCDEY